MVWYYRGRAACLEIVGPLVLFPHLRLLLGGEVTDDVQVGADLLHSAVLDEAGNARRAQVQQRGDIQVVGGQSQVVQGLVVCFDDKVSIELLDQSGKIVVLQRLKMRPN